MNIDNISLPFGKLSFKGGVARNAALKSFGLNYETEARDLDLIWWVPVSCLQDMEIFDGKLDFSVAEAFSEVVNTTKENIETLGYDVEIYPEGHERDYFESRDVNLNMVYMDGDGSIHHPDWLKDDILANGIRVIESDPWERHWARALLFSVRYKLKCDTDLFGHNFNTWLCLVKAASLDLAEEYASALGYSSLADAVQATWPTRGWDWKDMVKERALLEPLFDQSKKDEETVFDQETPSPSEFNALDIDPSNATEL